MKAFSIVACILTLHGSTIEGMPSPKPEPLFGIRLFGHDHYSKGNMEEIRMKLIEDKSYIAAVSTDYNNRMSSKINPSYANIPEGCPPYTKDILKKGDLITLHSALGERLSEEKVSGGFLGWRGKYKYTRSTTRHIKDINKIKFVYCIKGCECGQVSIERTDDGEDGNGKKDKIGWNKPKFVDDLNLLGTPYKSGVPVKDLKDPGAALEEERKGANGYELEPIQDFRAVYFNFFKYRETASVSRALPMYQFLNSRWPGVREDGAVLACVEAKIGGHNMFKSCTDASIAPYQAPAGPSSSPPLLLSNARPKINANIPIGNFSTMATSTPIRDLPSKVGPSQMSSSGKKWVPHPDITGAYMVDFMKAFTPNEGMKQLYKNGPRRFVDISECPAEWSFNTKDLSFSAVDGYNVEYTTEKNGGKTDYTRNVLEIMDFNNTPLNEISYFYCIKRCKCGKVIVRKKLNFATGKVEWRKPEYLPNLAPWEPENGLTFDPGLFEVSPEAAYSVAAKFMRDKPIRDIARSRSNAALGSFHSLAIERPVNGALDGGPMPNAQYIFTMVNGGSEDPEAADVRVDSMNHNVIYYRHKSPKAAFMGAMQEKTMHTPEEASDMVDKYLARAVDIPTAVAA